MLQQLFIFLHLAYIVYILLFICNLVANSCSFSSVHIKLNPSKYTFGFKPFAFKFEEVFILI